MILSDKFFKFVSQIKNFIQNTPYKRKTGNYERVTHECLRAMSTLQLRLRFIRFTINGGESCVDVFHKNKSYKDYYFHKLTKKTGMHLTVWHLAGLQCSLLWTSWRDTSGLNFFTARKIGCLSGYVILNLTLLIVTEAFYWIKQYLTRFYCYT